MKSFDEYWETRGKKTMGIQTVGYYEVARQAYVAAMQESSRALGKNIILVSAAALVAIVVNHLL